MKLLKATFNRVNLTQSPVRHPMTADFNAEVFQCLSEMPLRELVHGNHGDISELVSQLENDGVFTYRYGAMEPAVIPGIELGEVHTFEFLVELESRAVYTQRNTLMVVRGYVEGLPNSSEAKYHIVSTMSYRKDANVTDVYIVNNTLFCLEESVDARTLRTRDGVATYETQLDTIDLDDTVVVDMRASFLAGMQMFDNMEVSRSYYLARMVNAIIQCEINNPADDIFGLEARHGMVADQLNFPNMLFNPFVNELRNLGDKMHRTMCLDDTTLRQLFGDAVEAESKDLIKIRPVASAWDNSFESLAAYTIMQYLHGHVASLGVQTLELEIDEDGPVQPKYTALKDLDKGVHTYADITNVAESIHEQFDCQGHQVTAFIDFNVNGVSTVEVSVDGGEERIFEYASFASSYCNPLVTHDDSLQGELATMYKTIRDVIA